MRVAELPTPVLILGHRGIVSPLLIWMPRGAGHSFVPGGRYYGKIGGLANWRVARPSEDIT